MKIISKGKIEFTGYYIKMKPVVFVLFFFMLMFLSGSMWASESKEKDNGKFNPGEMIIEHVIDSHEWHIAEIGGKSISIPLPVILFYNGNLDVFCSSRFEHGNASYKGYKIETEGENKNKIVRVKGETMESDKTASLPLDLSITKNVMSLFISILLLCWIFISVANSYKRNPNKAPKGLQSFMEPLILFVRDDIAKPSIGEHRYEKYMPFLLSVFFFIFMNNLLGIVPFFPGGANLTGNIATTMTLAVFTFVITSFTGTKNYWLHIINTPGVPWWLKIPVPLMPIVEIMGVFTKPFVLMVRLFANMLAGHIIVLGFMSLIFIFGAINLYVGYSVSVVSVGFSIFMGLLEILVAFLQAYVFTLLSALYFGMAKVSEHEH
ncbi:MAG: F0F1 ATP synthase subunit A [Bacteroidota bacterium]|nr:F0F1 ATP synthase subunit A [Bacteroidota bacterium]